MPMYNLRIIHACSVLCAAILNIAPPLQVPQPLAESHLSQQAKTALAALDRTDYHGPGYAFSLAIATNRLHPSLAHIAVEYQKLIMVRETLHPTHGPPNEIDVRYVCLREASIEYRLQDLQFRVSLGADQDAIRLAMLVYSCVPLIAATGPTAALSQTLARNIRVNLERTDLETCWAACSDILLWILVIGSLLSYQEDQWPWFRSQVFGLMRIMDMTSFSDMEERLQACYYSRYIASISKVIWTEYQDIARLDEI